MDESEKEEIKNMHWSEIIAKNVAGERKPPFVVAAGITPSGPVHPGTLCEFLYAHAISEQLKRHGKASYVFISDDFDALDSVPEPLKEHEATIKEDMGMPLAYARDPKGCHKSFAEHFIAETLEIMKTFGVKPEFVRASELYSKGKYDKYARILCERKDEVKKVVQESSMRETMPADWFPLLPLCEKCKNIDKNVVLEYKDGWYKYKCSKCSHAGEDRIENHHYKLLFRLDWPTRQKFLNVVVEGGSVDHHSPGGTLSTVCAIHRKIYNEEPPYLYKFGLLKYKGKKYSKSKGIGHTVNELLTLAPPELIKYVLFRPDVQEDKELVMDKETLFPLLDEFRRVSQMRETQDVSNRADRKKLIAFELCEVKKIWKADIADAILYYNIYHDWKKAGELSGDAGGVGFLKPYLSVWMERGLVPDRYMFEISMKEKAGGLVKHFLSKLEPGMDAEAIHNAVFAVAQEKGIEAKEVFREIYGWLIGKDAGPRLGKMIYALGVKKVKEAAGV
ncbi:lysine--tRNA ligase [Candidatus Micrarchaeota archaeon]|nr:lysine--tRNA ligase [Candidatus Micrarchaeota archaeon]